jgi:hypothetical protein
MSCSGISYYYRRDSLTPPKTFIVKHEAVAPLSRVNHVDQELAEHSKFEQFNDQETGWMNSSSFHSLAALWRDEGQLAPLEDHDQALTNASEVLLHILSILYAPGSLWIRNLSGSEQPSVL